MDNIFDVITNKMPKPRAADAKALAEISPSGQASQQQPAQAPDIAKMPVKGLVALWQKDEKPEYTSELLRRMNPTITAAINSYAPNSGGKYDIKSAKLTLEALRAYDPKYGAEPQTYVFNNLKRLNRIAGQSTNIIKQSESRALERKLLQEASVNFEDDHGREPSIMELSELTGLSRKKVEQLLDAETVVVPESATLTESLHDTVTNTEVNDDDCFEYVYASVGPIDQKIMEWTSGKHGKPELSNNQIAAKLGVSAAAVSQRKNKIAQMLSDVRSLI